MRSQFYVEFPTDPVVNVHWKKADDGGGGPGDDVHITCGAWVKSMWTLGGLPGNGYWVLYPGGIVTEAGLPVFRDGSLYAQSIDTTPGHDPNKPANYAPVTDQYLWTKPGDGWTVTFSGFPGGLLRIGVWRGFSLHYLAKNFYTTPPTEISGTTATTVSMDIIPKPALDKGYPIIFNLYTVGDDDAAFLANAIPDLVQAHCANETTGGPPPPPYVGETPPPPPYTYVLTPPPYPVP